MRYAENKDQSAELLRLALPLMARQFAALHPVSYTLWYEHVAGINPSLSKVLEGRLQANTPLSEDEVYDLHARYIVARDVEVLERLQHRLRLGGEEFAVLLPETTPRGAEIVAQQIRAGVAAGRIRKIDGTELAGSVTLSLGVAVGRPGATLESLIMRADAALYEAKRKGRNLVCVDASTQ